MSAGHTSGTEYADLPPVREAVSVFHDAESLEGAVDELLEHGFDRAEVSILAAEEALHGKLGAKANSVRKLEDDPSVGRGAYVPRASIAEAEGAAVSALLFLGAILGTGAVALSGGTLAAAIAAAAGGSAGGGAIGGALAKLIGDRHAERLRRQIEAGGLLLWVNVRDQAHEERAREILTRNGGEDVHVHEVPVYG